MTGADGFIGKNLCSHLSQNSDTEVIKFTHDMPMGELDNLVQNSNFIFHLAGINRPEEEAEFFEGNTDLTELVCNLIKQSGKNIPIALTSSIQAEQANPYGRSKLQAETHLLSLHEQTGNSVTIYRLPNVFGKWCRPNYNSVVATFCHNICRGLPIHVNNPDTELSLVHVDDVISSFTEILNEFPSNQLYTNVSPVYDISLGVLADQLVRFRDSRDTIVTEPVGSGFTRALYATYISYLSPDNFKYPLVKHEDERGSFVEMLKTHDSGQFSFFTAHPGVTRGGHYHHIKTEKFLVLKGDARFGFRHIGTEETFEIITSGDIPEVVETVPGWSHDITNIGDGEMVVMLWANEIFDKNHPDTIAYKV